jgi:hypothetical protein
MQIEGQADSVMLGANKFVVGRDLLTSIYVAMIDIEMANTITNLTLSWRSPSKYLAISAGKYLSVIWDGEPMFPGCPFAVTGKRANLKAKR